VGRVFLSHDGSIDELLGTLLLAAAPEAELCGISYVDGDGLMEPVQRLERRLLRWIGRDDVRSSVSRARAFNSFPWAYRTDCVRMERLPQVQATPAVEVRPPYADGEAHLLEALRAGPLTLLATGPLTPVQLALEPEPALAARIERIVWMGGALDAPGNLEPHTIPDVETSGRAEWNAFWDPFAVDWVFRNTQIPLTIVPLDLVDRVPVAPEFLAKLQGSAPLSAAAYGLTVDQPFYRLWDMTAIVYALEPGLFAPPRAEELAVELWGPDQGALVRRPGGRSADVVHDFAAEGPGPLYDYVAGRLSGF